MVRPGPTFISRHVRLGHCGTFALAMLLAAATFPTAAHAQLTAETLLKSMVDDYGPKYQDVDTAIEHLRGGRVTEARDSLTTARRKNPNLPPANLLLAQILFSSKKGAAGQLALEEAVKEDSADPGAYVYMGELALNGRRWAESKLLYDKALQLAGNYTANQKRKNRLLVGTYSGLGRIAEVASDWETAKGYLEQVREIDPENSLALTHLGNVMFKLAKDRDDEREVFSIFKQVHANDKMTAYPDVNMAILYERAGKPANAKKLMERAAQNDSQNINTMLAVAKWGLEHGEVDMATQAAKAALQLKSDSVEGQIYTAMAARLSNDDAAAEQALKTAHLASPSNLAAITQLAQVLADSPEESQQTLALGYARLGAQLYPDLKASTGREAAVTLAWVLSRMKQDATAARAIEQVLKAGNGRLSANSSYYASQILYNQGMTEAARQLLERTLQATSTFTNRPAAEQLMAKIRNR